MKIHNRAGKARLKVWPGQHSSLPWSSASFPDGVCVKRIPSLFLGWSRGEQQLRPWVYQGMLSEEAQSLVELHRPSRPCRPWHTGALGPSCVDTTWGLLSPSSCAPLPLPQSRDFPDTQSAPGSEGGADSQFLWLWQGLMVPPPLFRISPDGVGAGDPRKW